MIPIAQYQKAPAEYQQLVIDTIKDKYPFLLLGVTVLLVFYLILSGLFGKNKIITTQKTTIEKAASTKQEQQIQTEQKTYKVKTGDDLWHIAQNQYGSGYNAYDLAKANNISNPGIIEVGQNLIIPSLTPKAPTAGEVVEAKTSQVKISGAQYTIQHGDNLWKIAQDAYGDGYAWIRIAEANHLSNPNIIHSGNTLIIPR